MQKSPESLWYGSYLKREQVRVLRESFKQILSLATDTNSKLKSKELLNAFDLAASNENGDMFQYPDPDLLKYKLEGVQDHCSKFRVNIFDANKK